MNNQKSKSPLKNKTRTKSRSTQKKANKSKSRSKNSKSKSRSRSSISKKKKSQKIFFDDNYEDIYVKILKDFERPKTGEVIASDFFYIKPSTDSDVFHKLYFELYGPVITIRKNPRSKEFGFIEIQNTFLRRSKTIIQGYEYYTIKFVKPKSYELIYSRDKVVIEKWFNLLKKWCILIKFSKHFKSMKVLGKGSFGMVYLVQRKTTKERYAVKVFQKKLIEERPEEKPSILNEIKIMRAINHPRLLYFEELYEGENHLYILTKLCEGKNLL